MCVAISMAAVTHADSFQMQFKFNFITAKLSLTYSYEVWVTFESIPNAGGTKILEKYSCMLLVYGVYHSVLLFLDLKFRISCSWESSFLWKIENRTFFLRMYGVQLLGKHLTVSIISLTSWNFTFWKCLCHRLRPLIAILLFLLDGYSSQVVGGW